MNEYPKLGYFKINNKTLSDRVDCFIKKYQLDIFFEKEGDLDNYKFYKYYDENKN